MNKEPDKCELCDSPVHHMATQTSGVLCKLHEREWRSSEAYGEFEELVDKAYWDALREFTERRKLPKLSS